VPGRAALASAAVLSSSRVTTCSNSERFDQISAFALVWPPVFDSGGNTSLAMPASTAVRSASTCARFGSYGILPSAIAPRGEKLAAKTSMVALRALTSISARVGSAA
jgi:hypothetical protein